MDDLEEIKELQKDRRALRVKLRGDMSISQAKKLFKELEIVNKRLMKLRDRN